MKKRVVALSLLMGSVLLANEGFRTEIDMTAGYNKFDSASKMGSTTFYGIRGTMYETEVNRYGLQVGYEGSFGVDFEGTKYETDIHRVYTHLIVDGEEEYHVTPYLLLGGGYEYLTTELKTEPSQGFVDLGLGFKYHLNDFFNILLETRAIGKFDTRDLEFNTNVGIGYQLGQMYKEKVSTINALEQDGIDKLKPQEEVAQSFTNVTANEELAPIDIVSQEPQSNVKFEKIVVDDRGVAAYDTAVYTQDVDAPAYDADTAYDAASMSPGAYFVQAAAYKSTNPQPLMQKLISKGFDNTTLHERGETTLVLVGPYASRAEAVRANKKLKHVKRDAFVTKIN